MNRDWMGEALCQHFPALPWITEPQLRSPSAVRAMEVVCRACPVHQACKEYAEQHEISSGFWAGTDQTPPELAETEDGVA